MSLTQKSKIMAVFCVLALIFLMAASWAVIKGTAAMQDFSKKKFDSILLAQEVRATSAGLTASVRAYVNTGDPDYETAYWDYERIRAGELERPVNSPVAPGKKIPIEALFEKSEFTEKEQELLKKSVFISRELIKTEEKAIYAVKGIFQDRNGYYTIIARPDKEYAKSLLFGSEYEAVVSQIMGYSYEFIRVVTERLNNESLEISRSMELASITLAVGVTAVTLIVLAWVLMILFHVIRPINDCAVFARTVAAGDLNTSYSGRDVSARTDEIHMLVGSIRLMIDSLKDRINVAEEKMAEAQQARAEAELADMEQRKLQSLSDAKNIYFASMSHEIRTPINAISGLSDLLLRDNLTEVQRKHMKDIRSSTVSLNRIISDILDSAKMEMGKLELTLYDYNFLELVDNVSSVTGVLAREKGLNFICKKESGLPLCLYGDGDRVRQIMLNLLSNAVKYTKEGTVCLKVSAPNNSLVFEISDTGIGIKDEVLPHLFYAFIQAGEKKNKGIVGTGLGLYIVKVLVELMHGNISVKTAYGEGSVFKVTLPLKLGDEKALEASADSELTYTWDASVLVVDDNEINLNVAMALLEFLGIEPEVAISGEESLRMLREKTYDLIFMDHMMPGMDGAQTTVAIRAMGGWRADVPIIALTANATGEARDMLLTSGMNDFLSKPIDISMLRAMLDKWLPSESKKS